MSEDKVILLAKKLKELAERGVGGEKNSAEYHLKKHLEKHNLTLEDIIGEKREKRMFKFKNTEHKKFLYQIVASVIVGDFNIYGNLKGKKVWFELTLTEYFEIEAKYDFYWKALKEEEKIFYSAFIQKNKLYKKRESDDKDDNEISDEEKEKIRRMFEMMGGIKEHTLTKQIGK